MYFSEKEREEEEEETINQRIVGRGTGTYLCQRPRERGMLVFTSQPYSTPAANAGAGSRSSQARQASSRGVRCCGGRHPRQGGRREGRGWRRGLGERTSHSHYRGSSARKRRPCSPVLLCTAKISFCRIGLAVQSQGLKRAVAKGRALFRRSQAWPPLASRQPAGTVCLVAADPLDVARQQQQQLAPSYRED